MIDKTKFTTNDKLAIQTFLEDSINEIGQRIFEGADPSTILLIVLKCNINALGISLNHRIFINNEN